VNSRELFAKWKRHLTFVGIFVFVVALNLTIGLTSGQSFLGAAWRAFAEIRPIEYVMFALFWYACVVHRPKDDWDTSFISLNLARSTNRK
jgi:hypothetical protein